MSPTALVLSPTAFIAAARGAVAEWAESRPGRGAAVDRRILIPRLLLRLYRHTELESVDWCVEIDAILSNLEAQGAYPPFTELDDLELARIDDVVAAPIHARHHYLGTHRGGIHVGLFATGHHEPISLATLSEMDVTEISARLPDGVEARQVLLLSRLYSHPEAPRNTLSMTLAKMMTWLRRQRPDIRLVVTYCDPNLGFSGSVYRAANWRLLGREPKSAYYYVEGDYITHRELNRRFGTFAWDALAARAGGRVTRSTVELLPLEIWAGPVRRSARPVGAP